MTAPMAMACIPFLYLVELKPDTKRCDEHASELIGLRDGTVSNSKHPQLSHVLAYNDTNTRLTSA